MTGYAVNYRVLGSTTWIQLPDTTGTTVTISGLSLGTTYEVRVAATNAAGTGPWSTIEASTSAPMRIAVDTTLAGDDPRQVTLPLRGEVDVTIDWGGPTDGCPTSIRSADQTTDTSCTYTADDTYEILVSGTVEHFGAGEVPYSPDNAPRITAVTSWGDLTPTSLDGAFRGATNLIEVPEELPASVTSTARMFEGATAFNQPLADWDVSFVTDMFGMFRSASAFNQDLSGWCVASFPGQPDNFDLGAMSWLDLAWRPQWGSCPV